MASPPPPRRITWSPQNRVVWCQLKQPVECPICLEFMHRAFRTPCNHTFHTACLREAYKRKRACPYCRTALRLPRQRARSVAKDLEVAWALGGDSSDDSFPVL